MLSYNTEEIANRIRTLRIQQGYTQEAAAELLGVERSHLSRMERGQKGCSVELLIRLAQLYRVSMDYLVLGPDWAARWTGQGLDQAIRILMGLRDGQLCVQETQNLSPGLWKAKSS